MSSMRRSTLAFLATGAVPVLLPILAPATLNAAPVEFAFGKGMVERACGGGGGGSVGDGKSGRTEEDRRRARYMAEREAKVKEEKEAKAKAVSVQANPNHDQLLASADPRLAANKRLVYDFWREVFEAGHVELAGKYLAESYVQHNSNAPVGRAGFVESFSKSAQPKAIESRVKASLVTIVAEGDLVTLGFAAEGSDPKDAAKKFTTTWFDMYRIEGGRITEHWDASPIDVVGHFNRSSR